MKPPRSSYKRLIILSISFPVIVGVVALLLAMLPIWDGPPVDDSDMQFVHREIPDEQNAFPLFRQAYERLEIDIAQWDAWRDLSWEDNDHREMVRAWADQHHETFRLISEGIDLGFYEVPGEEMYGSVISFSEVMRLHLAMRYASKSETDPNQALDWHLLQLRYADMIFYSGNTTTEVSIGLAMYASALENILEQVQNNGLETESLWNALEVLKAIRPDPERVVRSMQKDYLNLVLFMESELRTHPETAVHEEDFYNWSLTRTFVRPGAWGYQEENTKRLLLDFLRPHMAYLRGEGDYVPIETAKELLTGGTDFSSNFIGRSFNFFGRYITYYAIFTQDLVRKYKHGLADLHATRVVITLHLYTREHGGLPDTLDALVPAYLDEVPADPFDGQPFRYLPEQARIYSIGTNRVDNGGSIRLRPGRRDHSRNDSEDRVYGIFEKVEWGEEEG